MERHQTTVHISALSVFKAAMVIIGLLVLYILRDVVLVVIAAIVIASAIEPVTKWFKHYRVPRLASVVITYAGVALVLFGTVYFILPSMLADAANFISQIPTYFSAVELSPFIENISSATSTDVLTGLSRTLSAQDLVTGFRSFLEIPGSVFGVVSSVFGGFFSFILVIILSFYFAVQERGIENFLRIVTPHTHQAYAIDLWERSQKKIGRWMQGQLLLMLIVGVLVFLGLTILGVKHALLFALLAALFELIPLFGPIISSIPAILVAFGDGGLTAALLVTGLYIIIQQFENHLIYPLVVNKVVGVPAMVVILALIIGAQLGGLLGALLSVPLAAAFMEFIHDLKLQNAPKRDHTLI